MGPSVGKTSPSTRGGTFTFVRPARFSPRRASWSMMGRPFSISREHATVVAAHSKAQCCTKSPFGRIQRSLYEEARDVARAVAKTEAFERSCRDRKRVEMLFAHLKRIFRLSRLRLRGPCGAQFEFTLAAIAQNLRRLAKLVVRPPPIATSAEFRGSGGPSLTSERMEGNYGNTFAPGATHLSSPTSATKSAQSGHSLVHCTSFGGKADIARAARL